MIPRQYFGTAIIIIGVISGIVGSTINDMGMHMAGILVWTTLTNPLLFIWAIGSHQKWWNSSLSFKALALLYGVYEIGGVLALWYLG